MLKNKIPLLAICCALLIIESLANPLSLPSSAAVSQTSPKTVRVRLMEVETNADVVDWPSPGSEIIIKAGATTLNKKTDENGVVVFNAVPCGQRLS
jgi:hypothetical protein